MKHLILLHGALGAQDQLNPLAELLSAHFTLHRPLFSGHGGSPFASLFSIEQFVAELVRFSRDLHLDNVDSGVGVFGYSMGGYVALAAAQLNPLLFNRVITLGTKWHWDEAVVEKEKSLIQPEVIKNKFPAFAAQLEKRHAPNDWRQLLEKTALLLEGLGENRLIEQLDISTLDIPIHLLIGDRDKTVTLMETLEMFKRLPKAAMGMLPFTAHPIEKVNLTLLYHFILQSLGKDDI